jgi:predicted AAA+ superfamily ATPase
VDIVLEQGHTAIAGIEVKAAATVRDADFRGLRKLRDAAGKRFKAGVVLYDGTATIDYRNGLFAVPLRRLWEA